MYERHFCVTFDHVILQWKEMDGYSTGLKTSLEVSEKVVEVVYVLEDLIRDHNIKEPILIVPFSTCRPRFDSLCPIDLGMIGLQ